MDKSLKILMLEDSESDAGLVLRSLKKANIAFESMRVDTREEFVDALDQFMPDVILSDHSLPQFNSLEAYKVYQGTSLKIPFILITGTVSEEFAVRCLHEGIDDYILKDNLTRLPSAISNALKKKELELKKKELELEQAKHIEKLRQQNEELIKINKELDRFVYSASHELRAPLTSVLGLITLTNIQLADKQYGVFEEYLHMMETSINKLNSTVQEIIHYSTNNRTEINRDVINFEDLMGKIIEKLSYMEGIGEVEKRIEIEQSCAWYSDKSRLVTVLDNLVSNAVKYRSKENALIVVKVQVLPDKVYISVADNGVGIGAKFVDKIFDMFYRASSLSEGSGLGLYIVKETLEKLNGTIKVHSVLDEGTTFNIELPNLLI